jgi:hypothetical protein
MRSLLGSNEREMLHMSIGVASRIMIMHFRL